MTNFIYHKAKSFRKYNMLGVPGVVISLRLPSDDLHYYWCGVI